MGPRESNGLVRYLSHGWSISKSKSGFGKLSFSPIYCTILFFHAVMHAWADQGTACYYLCGYVVKWWNQKSTWSVGKKCTNTPILCPVVGCNTVVWKYALQAHWCDKHSAVVGGVPSNFLIGALERRYMKGLEAGVNTVVV